jgi:hypothetical protein
MLDMDKMSYQNVLSIPLDRAPGHSYQIIRSAEGIEGVRRIWESMQSHPNADVDFYLTIISCRTEVLSPHIIILKKDESPVAMIIGRMETIPIRMTLGYMTLWSVKARSLTVVYGGLLGDQSETTAKCAVDVLFESLKKGEAEIVSISHVRHDSSLYRIIKAHPNFLCRDHGSMANDHFSLDLDRSRDDVLLRLSSKHRRRLRYLPKVLERQYPGAVEIRCYKSLQDVPQVCQDADRIMINTYQRGMGVGFVKNDEMTRRMMLAAEKHWLSSYVLYVASKPSAFWIGSIYKEVLYLQFTGFDPVLSKYELGTILLNHIINDMASNYPQVKRIDFGFGDALYKQRFANECWLESTIHIPSVTIKGISIGVLKTLDTKLSKSAAFLLKKVGLSERLKKMWRMHFAS